MPYRAYYLWQGFCSETETNYGNYGWLFNNWTLLNSHLVCVIADVDVGYKQGRSKHDSQGSLMPCPNEKINFLTDIAT